MIEIGKPALPDLETASSGKDPEVTRRAKKCVEKIKSALMIDGFVADLRNPDWKIRLRGATGLVSNHEMAHGAVPALIEALDDSNDEVRGAVMAALWNLGAAAQPATPKLIAMLKDNTNSPSLRWLVCRVLQLNSEIDAGGAVPILLEMLDDKEARLRHGAVIALGTVGTNHPAAVPALVKCLKDEVSDVRGAAAHSLGRRRQQPDRVAPALARRLAEFKESPMEGSPLAVERYAILEALESVGAAAQPAIPSLRSIVTNRREDTDSRLAAMRALAGMGPAAKPAVPDLIAVLGSDGFHVQVAAASALGNIGPAAQDALPTLRGLLKEGNANDAVAEAIRAIESGSGK